MTVSNTIKATANARFPLAICASLGRKGAPAATPNSRSPTASGSTSRSARASTTAPTGISTKFANSDIATRRRLRSGAVICPTLSPNPTDNMLDTTKTSVATGTARSSAPISAVVRPLFGSYADSV